MNRNMPSRPAPTRIDTTYVVPRFRSSITRIGSNGLLVRSSHQMNPASNTATIHSGKLTLELVGFRDQAQPPAAAARWLVHHDSRIGQRSAASFGSGGEEKAAHARGHADARRADGRREMLHRIVDRETRRDDATGRVDVELDLLPRRVGLEEEKLRDENIRNIVVHLAAEEDDAVHQQAREDVVGSLAARRALDHVGNV